MGLDNTDILFASLVGSKLAEQIPRLNVVQNELGKHALPLIPFLPIKKDVKVTQHEYSQFDNQWKSDAALPEEKQFFPLSFSVDEGNTWYLLPYETMINISGRNNLVRRNVAKWKKSADLEDRKGTVKERWSYDDYEINITGILIGSLTTGNVEDCYPISDFLRLKDLIANCKVRIKCTPLELLGVNYIVIEDFSLPFTKGENVQAYTIKAYSDYKFSLILT
ncbi:hypothetical protein GCM10007424_23820 [Flavobacterium suaedae]|uniref:DUF6046 domain-containing protein n=1 Tax=Flavobacterium suaedae TaxID=1767027 RepID=A0ABQ1JZG1_9FLAO|nr:DUF6046 domain-containing protein [Flavobacterium suaedae]GGB83032.1 hypothetical protein GCM10007424_23820 [Flavobacterium suaedae]